jgi:hypothetical protein
LTRRLAATGTVVALVVGCGSSKDGDDALRSHFARAVAQVRTEASTRKLRASLGELVADRPSTAEARKARRLAIAGLAATLAGRESRRRFIENDSGNIEAATRDAKSAYRWSKRGTRLLRAAGRLLGVRVPL